MMKKIALAALVIAASSLVGAYATAVQSARVLDGLGKVDMGDDDL